MLKCYLGPGRLAVLERWLPNTVTILDRFHCTTNCHNISYSSTTFSSTNTYIYTALVLMVV